jgi:hypothetical protein
MFYGKVSHFILLNIRYYFCGKIHSANKESMPYHIQAARKYFCYIHETGKADFVDGNDFPARKSCFRRKARHTIWSFI